MSMSDLISIIVPVYNAENYIKACLDSLLAQTYKNLQIILIDDGSTDSSGIICDEYAERDSRIEVYHQRNKGQAAARNAGLIYAKGEWIGFADNDDIIEPQMFEILLENAITYNVLISGCATNTVYEDGSTVNKFEKVLSGVKLGDDLVLDILYQTSLAWGAMWNKIYHKSLIDRIVYPNGSQLEDYWVSIQLYHNVGKIYFDCRPFYNWIQRSNSQSHKKFSRDKLSIFEMAEKIKEYCFTINNSDIINASIFFSYLSYVNLIWNICRSGDIYSIKIAKENINVARKNLKNIDWHGIPIDGMQKYKYLFKLILCEIYLKVRI